MRNFAIIGENGIVETIVYAREDYDELVDNAVPTEDRDIGPDGDCSYANGKFFRNGEEVLTEVERLRKLLGDGFDFGA